MRCPPYNFSIKHRAIPLATSPQVFNKQKNKNFIATPQQDSASKAHVEVVVVAGPASSLFSMVCVFWLQTSRERNAPIKVSKPRKAFMNDADLQVRLFEADPERNAPIKVSKPRKAFMNDADLQVRLFEADPEPVEADTEDVYRRGLDFISGRLL